MALDPLFDYIRVEADLPFIVFEGSPLFEVSTSVPDLDVVVVDGAVELFGGLPGQVDTPRPQHCQVGDLWGAGTYRHSTSECRTCNIQTYHLMYKFKIQRHKKSYIKVSL